MTSPTVTIKLGAIDYPVAWGNLAMYRFRSVPISQRVLVGPAQLAQLTWAAYRGVQLPYPSWEHVLAVLCELDQAKYDAIDAAVASILPEPDPEAEKQTEKDSKPEPEPSDAEKKSDLTASALLPGVGSA